MSEISYAARMNIQRSIIVSFIHISIVVTKYGMSIKQKNKKGKENG